jgi:trk system potassium uptake protein TrkA
VNIIIVGGGQVGATLAASLARDGHDVTAIEADAAKVRDLSETLDARLIEGNGATAPVLRRAGAESADVVVATSDSDEVNFVVGRLAASVFEVPRVVVRLRNPDHVEGFTALSQDHPGEHVCVNPDAAAVDHILSLLEVPGAIEVGSFMDGELLVAGFRIGQHSDFAGLTLSHIQLMFADTTTLVAAIHRDDEWIIPHGTAEIRANDLVYFAVARDQLSGVVSLVGEFQERRRQVLVAGASRIGLELARRLEPRQQVTLIEKDRERAQRASDLLGESLVIHGQPTDHALLEEEDIERVGTFVAVTDDHESNLVAGLLAPWRPTRPSAGWASTPSSARGCSPWGSSSGTSGARRCGPSRRSSKSASKWSRRRRCGAVRSRELRWPRSAFRGACWWRRCSGAARCWFPAGVIASRPETASC